MPLTAGAQLASYQTLTLIGAGGMGEVYLARDLKLGREVAIKILRDELAQETTPTAILVGVSSTIFVGLFIAGYWNRLLAQRLRLLHKLHPHDIEQWAGEAMLSDPNA